MKLVKRAFSATSAAVIGLSTLMTLGFTGVAAAAGQTCVWTGTGGDTNFSTAGNWTGCGGGAPQDGDTISFGVNGNTSYNLTNDLSGNLAGVTFGDSSQGTSTFTTYNLSKLHLANNAVITGVNAQGASYSNVSVKVGSDYTVAGNLTLNGHIGVNGSAATVAVQNLTIGNGEYANYSSGMEVHQYHPTGTVDIGEGAAYVPTNGESAIQVENGASLFPGGSLTGAELTVPVVYGGGSGSGNPIVSPNDDVTLSGQQTLQHNISAQIYGSATLTITGPITGNYTITKTDDSTGTLVINSSSNGSATPNGTTETAVTTTTISDSQPNATLNIPNKSIIILDGERGAVYLDAGGTLKGTGTMQSLIAGGGIIAPGHSPGKLTILGTLQLNSSTTYQAELQTKDNYDQLQVSSASSAINQDVTLSDAKLEVSLYDGFKIAAGDTFTIINNLQPSNIKVSGTFAGLPEGATFKVGSGVFKISYVGGDGNDVVLTVVTAPTTPDTGFAFVGSNPVATLGAAVVAAGAIVFMARKMRPSTVRVRASSRRRK